MINTSSMYGNLQEEEDPFMQIQKLRALKSAKYGPNKTRETIKNKRGYIFEKNTEENR